jgi:peptide chain release factor subunit 1
MLLHYYLQHIHTHSHKCTQQIALVEWIANNYKTFGAVLEFVTNRSQEGSQFCRGFGGIGGLLRWQVDFAQLDEANYGDEGILCY